MFVGQIDLNIAFLRHGPQIILTHQPIKIDRAGRTGVGLIIHDILNLRQFGTDFAQDACSFFQRRADRHIDNDLKLALVVERQHLQDNQLKVSQRHRAKNQQNNANRQLETHCRAFHRVKKRRQQLAESAV